MTSRPADDSHKFVQVWDLPTRLFHWTLVALIVVGWFTGEGEGGTASIHRYAGEAVAGLIVFRVLWGFIGGEHSRFSDFAAGPNAIAAHVRELFSKSPKSHLGHNPLGGVAVFLLLINVTVIVVTGLFSGGEDNFGPFAGRWGLQLSEAHEASFRVLQILAAIHILGVVVESWKTRDALVPAMFTGLKRRRADQTARNATRGGQVALLIAITLGLATTIALATTPPSGLSVSEHGHQAD